MAEKITTKPKGGYGKRPLSFWVVLYVVIGSIVYGLVYLLLMKHGSSGGGFSY